MSFSAFKIRPKVHNSQFLTKLPAKFERQDILPMVERSLSDEDRILTIVYPKISSVECICRVERISFMCLFEEIYVSYQNDDKDVLSLLNEVYKALDW